MPAPRIDRKNVRFAPLAQRANRVDIERDHVDPSAASGLDDFGLQQVHEVAGRVKKARASGRPVVLAFGAHTIKNGLCLVLQKLVERKILTHLATNGAGVIHDWEFAWQGKSSEHVADNVRKGLFGNWEETGFFINLAINAGAYHGLGYGEAVGSFISREGVPIPSHAELEQEVHDRISSDPARAAVAADLLSVVRETCLPAGFLAEKHAWKKFSIQAFCFEHGVPFTAHPMIGHDIIYNHPMNHGGLLGRAAIRDFESFAHSISNLEDGVYLSLGSAVMSPMVFEKSFSIAQNLAIQKGRAIERHFIGVVDLAPGGWDWSQGEPPENHPAYYARYNKSFSRMGGTMQYLSMDNRDFLLALLHAL